MRKTVLFLLGLLVGYSLADAQVRVATAYNYPLVPGTPEDSVLNGTKSIRGVNFDVDVDGDGNSEIVATNYFDLGHVHIFEAVGNDSIQLVWTSPRVATDGGSSTPRYPLFGDLDNDGKKEVIYQSNGNGIYIFEWDGIVGSDNYGTVPSQLIGTAFLSGVSGNCEYMEVTDVDGDGQNELLVAYNASASADDRYYIISALGDWSTNNPGFSSFTVEYEGQRTQLGTWGGNGSPVAMITANFDGTGNKEILIHNWNIKNVLPMTVPAANTYVISDTTNGKQNIMLGGVFDYVALFSGLAYDIDGDGRDEVYLPTFAGSLLGPENGIIHMISYAPGQNTLEIDSTNVTRLDVSGVSGDRSIFGYGYGDIDLDGNKDFYTSTSYPYNVISIELAAGSDKTNPANWTARLLYAGESDIFTEITYIDSAGVLDTIGVVETAFSSKIYARDTDFDGDGLEDLILPYQALSDSITVRNLTWNSGTSQFDTVTTRIPNPKRWGLRIVERDPALGVKGKDVTIITPDDYRLEQNYPNPFNPTTTISFYLPVTSRISLTLYDILGKEVRTLINNEEYVPGVGQVVWDGRNNAGNVVVSGTYFYTLRFGNFEKTNKMMFLK